MQANTSLPVVVGIDGSEAAKEPDLPVREADVRDRTAPALVAASMTADLLVVDSTAQSVLSRAGCPPIVVVPIGSGAER